MYFLNHQKKSDKRIDQDFLVYSINEDDSTASVFGYKSNAKEEIIIPRSIKHNLKEYIITSIWKQAFQLTHIKSIQFSPDSEIRTIEREAFGYSSIERLSFPSSLIDLKEGWCIGTKQLNNIIIDKNNPKYTIYENEAIIGKTSIEEKNFDVFVFCFRNIKTITIPNFIQTIGTSSFERCQNLNKIDFESNSQLKSIEKCAFYELLITSFTIPPHLTKIGEFAFYNCKNLQMVKIPPNSELRIIGKNAFSDSSIQQFSVPLHLTQICAKAFSNCHKLKKVEIPSNSELQIIEKEAFSFTPIQNFTIPPHLIQINENVFFNCNKLQRLEIPMNSELQIIAKNAFFNSSINYLEIPKSLIDLKEGWCNETNFLNNIIIEKNNPKYTIYEDKAIIGKTSIEEKNFDVLVFCFRNTKIITIPNFIQIIGTSSFERCQKLKQIDFESNSQLKLIDKNAFGNSSIEYFSIPNQLEFIDESAFYNCKNLQRVDINSNSQLRRIGAYAFAETSIKCFQIPSLVEEIDVRIFSKCKQLQIVEINGNLDTETICQRIFFGCNEVLIMIPRNQNL